MFNLKQDYLFYLFFIATFDDLDGTLKRLNTLKYLVNQYHMFFTSNLHILVAVRYFFALFSFLFYQFRIITIALRISI
jgi:hypothetical protein